MTPVCTKMTPMEFLHFFSDSTWLSMFSFFTPKWLFFTPVAMIFFFFDCTLTLFLLPQILRCRRVYRGVRAVSSILVLAENPWHRPPSPVDHSQAEVFGGVGYPPHFSTNLPCKGFLITGTLVSHYCMFFFWKTVHLGQFLFFICWEEIRQFSF